MKRDGTIESADNEEKAKWVYQLGALGAEALHVPPPALERTKYFPESKKNAQIVLDHWWCDGMLWIVYMWQRIG